MADYIHTKSNNSITITLSEEVLFRLQQVSKYFGQANEEYVYNALLDALRRDGLFKDKRW